MKYAIAALVLTFCTMSFASGPSYQDFEVAIKADSVGASDIVSCENAKKKALQEAYDGAEHSNNTRCENEVVSSACQCQALKTGPFACTYTGTVICTEEVWYP